MAGFPAWVNGGSHTGAYTEKVKLRPSGLHPRPTMPHNQHGTRLSTCSTPFAHRATRAQSRWPGHRPRSHLQMTRRKSAEGLTVQAIARTYLRARRHRLCRSSRLPGVRHPPHRPHRSGGVLTAWSESFPEHHPAPRRRHGFFPVRASYAGLSMGDYSTKPDHDYTYWIVAMSGTPAALLQTAETTVRVSTEPEDDGVHGDLGSTARRRRIASLRQTVQAVHPGTRRRRGSPAVSLAVAWSGGSVPALRRASRRQQLDPRTTPGLALTAPPGAGANGNEKPSQGTDRRADQHRG